MLAVEGLSKTYSIRKAGLFGSQPRRVAALDDVSFEVRRGECLGLVGESGCGKTTLSKVIMRAVGPDAGRVTITDDDGAVDVLALNGEARSEEHTSELQSLMRISYAVFCLKKKNKSTNSTQELQI